MAILSFKSRLTQALFEGKAVPRYAQFRASAERKLELIDSATSLDFLRTPLGNRLEALSGDRRGQFSIRINGQFRICFVWTDDGPQDVEIVDYL